MNNKPNGRSNKWLRLLLLAVLVVPILLVVLFVSTILYYKINPYEHVPAETVLNAGTRSDFYTIRATLEAFYLDNQRYPTELEGLGILVKKHNIYKYSGDSRMAVIDKLPPDPWGNPYIYSVKEDGIGYVLTSLGRDEARGGEGRNKDYIMVSGH